ncbi:hypothetical protein AKJ09_02519 [Labilithrix luteola]|uniref:SSD domain-containing protein n=1 Tax=Labilithrix luteola TaxID=1391654 RepID=A0A0K1PQN8_9BACT|nr:MMPL family transporter [Labilithrix luteola]AKU95855.1 hypothetical protein AKJ09_02519 [Labilithrix luteola]
MAEGKASTFLARIGGRIEVWLGALSSFCFRHAPAVAAVLVGLTLAFALSARSLRIDTDLTSLLPDTFESVRDVRDLTKEFGGVGYVSVVVHGKDKQTVIRFAEDVAPKLAALKNVRYVDYKRPVSFFRDHALYYLDQGDLESVRDRITERRDWEVSRATGSLLDDEEEAPPVSFTDLEEKYRARLALDSDAKRGKEEAEYYLDETGTRLALLVKPMKLASDLSFAKEIVADVEHVLADVDKSAYGEGFSVELSGRYKKRVDLAATLSRDLEVASAIAFALVLAYVALHFRRLAAVVLVLVPLAFTLAATYGMAALTIGSLNIITSFIGAILLGIAIDNGIHLLGRYDEMRAAGMPAEEAVRTAFGEAGRASMAATLTNVGAFLCLLIADFKAFREFGVLAASGMFFTLLGYLTVLPVMLGLGARLFTPKPVPEAPPLKIAKPMIRLAPAIFAVMTVILIVSFGRIRGVHFNYDFAALDEANLPSFRLDREVNKLIGRSQTPLVVLAKSADDAEATAADLRERAKNLGKLSSIDRVVAPTDLVPKAQQAKRAIMEQVAEIAGRLREDKMTEEQIRQKDELVRMASTVPFGLGDLPEEVRRQFRSVRTNELADFVLVYPSVSLSDGRTAQRMAEEVRHLKLPDGREIHAKGEALVLSDILTSMEQELPLIFLLAFLQQLVVLWIFMGSFGRAMLTIFPAVVTIPLLAGFLGLFGLEFNYLNVILLPALLGMGEDGGAHLVSRVSAGEPLGDALGHTARATFGAGLTTLFGFGCMVIASHPGLRMFGAVAILGIAINMAVCIFFLPALMAILERGKRYWKESRGDLASVPSAIYHALAAREAEPPPSRDGAE